MPETREHRTLFSGNRRDTGRVELALDPRASRLRRRRVTRSRHPFWTAVVFEDEPRHDCDLRHHHRPSCRREVEE
jgi:hypothetical protein